MKRFILFLFVFFAALNLDIKAQNIDSLVVSQAIDCPLDPATLDAYLSQTQPPVSYNIVLQTLQFGGWQLQEDVQNTQITFYSFTALQAGMYRLLLTDPSMTSSNYPTGNNPLSNPLVIAVQDTFIPGPSPLNMIPEDDTLDCWDQTIANLTVTFTGLTSPYVTWLEDDAGNPIIGSALLPIPVTGSAHTFTGLSAGDYVIWGNDFNGCGPDSVHHNIDAPDTLRPTPHIDQDISCYQAGDGIVSVDPTTGGTPPYTYLWSGGAANGLTTSTVAGLGPGTYTCTITDDLGCDTTVTLTLIEPQELSASVDTIGSNDCHGDCDVIISVNILLPGSGGPYTYLVDGTANFPPTSSTFLNQCAGSYTVDVQDANGCPANNIITNPVVIPEPDPITVYASSLDYNGFDVSCFGSCDGEITIDSVTGGNLPPYGTSFPYLGGIAFSPDTIIDSAFCAGTYIDTVTDDLGCIGTFQVVMDEPTPFTISALQLPNASGYDVSCPEVCDGIVNVSPSGGAPGMINYFLLDPSLNDSANLPNGVQFLGVCGFNTNGEDTIYAINANGCIDTTYTQLSEPPLFDWTKDSVMENCALGNGQATVEVLQGGSGTYIHHWTGPFGNNAAPPFFHGAFPGSISTIPNLQYGWYVDSVADASGSGCYFIDSMLVDSGSIDVDVQVLTPCNDSSGVITVTSNIVLTSIVWATQSNFSAGTILQNDSNFTTSILEDVGTGWYYYDIQLIGCDPYQDSAFVGPGVTMDASLDALNSVLDLDCFADMTDSIFIDVVDGFGLLNSPLNNNFNAYTIDPVGPQNVAIGPGNHNFLLAGFLPAGSYNIVVTPSITDAFGNALFTNCFDTNQCIFCNNASK